MPEADITRVATGDGSETLHSRKLGEIYHSRHGAVTESMHVYIGAGLGGWEGRAVGVFEVGHGTGLNAFLATRWARDCGARLDYLGIDPEPVDGAILDKLALGPALQGESDAMLWRTIRLGPWEKTFQPASGIGLTRRRCALADCPLAPASCDVVFFDAFAPEVQPELWTATVFASMRMTLRPGGRLVTYCAKGAVRRAMQEAGLRVEKLPGPPGKREMLRAWAPG